VTSRDGPSMPSTAWVKGHPRGVSQTVRALRRSSVIQRVTSRFARWSGRPWACCCSERLELLGIVGFCRRYLAPPASILAEFSSKRILSSRGSE
jgi:hypothetical protein